VVSEFLRRVDILPWEDPVARTYGPLSAQLLSQGITLSPLDMQIAAHALHVKVVLVSSDAVFKHVAPLDVENWLEYIKS
jgi:tRNA(fMet)-specific endonuclease VapC